jgi:hypothetical protein
VHRHHQLVPCEPRLIPWSKLCPQIFLHLTRSSITSILDGDAAATFEKKWKSEAANGIEFRNNKREKQKMKQVVELKHAISAILSLPDSFMVSSVKSLVIRGETISAPWVAFATLET